MLLFFPVFSNKVYLRPEYATLRHLSLLPLKNNLFRVVFRITGDVEQSEQIVQEALLKVWEDRDSWIVIENLPSYCMMVARNLALRETYSGNKERMERYAVR